MWHACRLMVKDASDRMSDTAVVKFPGLFGFKRISAVSLSFVHAIVCCIHKWYAN